jgi:AraC-like DNA-binding protein
VVGDSPDTTPAVTVLRGQVCVDADGRHLAQTMRVGANTWGNSVDGDTTMLVGSYHSDGELGHRLVEALPEMLVVRARDWASPLVDLLIVELTASRAGQRAALDRLVDLLVIDIVRSWAGANPAATTWLTGGADSCVAEALRLIQDSCDRPWTVAALAQHVGLSRAAFARRFSDAIGQAPIGYLTEWRMALAADLLREPDASVASVAARVGYPSPFTFSTAFKRHFGSSPRHHRLASA